jgi:hypothetical protein
MSSLLDMVYGLPTPRTEEERLTPTMDGMRQAIARGSRDSALIRNCLNAAEYRGLSGEDKYVLLAYHALVELEKFWQQTVELRMKLPNPPMIFKEPQ